MATGFNRSHGNGTAQGSVVKFCSAVVDKELLLNTQSRKIRERFRTFFMHDYCGFGEFGIGPTAVREWSKPSCEATKAKPNP